ncbi:MAG TPA: hypothetical protein VME20_13665 [Acidimicrobiales bacterium]|nr:hypothetical protein [Acidimicrobiales bacterium]
MNDLGVNDERAVRGRNTDRKLGSLHGNSLRLLVSSAVVGLGNYGFSLALVWLLPSKQFSHVASATALLLVVGTASASMLPWVVARAVARYPFGSLARRQAIEFSLMAALVLGGSAGALMAALAAPYAPVGVCALLVITSVALFISGAASGFQMGEGRYTLMATLSVIEVVIKLGAGIGLVLVGGGATGAFAGSALGAFMWAGSGLWFMRREARFRWRRPPLDLLRQLGGVGSTQVLATIITTMDVIVGSIVIGSAGGFATYQTMLVFARIPTFVATSLSGVVYPKLAGTQNGQSRAISEASSLYLVLAIAIAAVVATTPTSLFGLFLPDRYLHSLGLLLPMALAGVAGGQLNLSTTFLQAHLAFRAMLNVLLTSLPLIVVEYILFGTTIRGLAWSAAAGVGAVALVIYLQTAHRYGPAHLRSKALGYAISFVVVEYVLRFAEQSVPMWLTCAAILGLLVMCWARPRKRKPGPLRVLFLESPEQLPGVVRDAVSAFQEALVSRDADVTVAFSDGRSSLCHDDSKSACVRFDKRFDHLTRGHWYSAALRLPLTLGLLFRYKPDLIVNEVGSSSSSVIPWVHRATAIAFAPNNLVRGHHYLSAREFRSYAQVLLWSPNGKLRSHHSKQAAAKPSDKVVSNERDEVLGLCLSACTEALAEQGVDLNELSASRNAAI